MKKAFPKPVLQHLASLRGSFSSLLSSTCHWEVSFKKKNIVKASDRNKKRKTEIEAARKFLTEVLQTDQRMTETNSCNTGTDVELTEHLEAKWTVSYGSSNPRKECKMRIKPGDIIQSLTCLPEDMLSKSAQVSMDLTYDQYEECHRAFWMVVSIFGTHNPQEISPLSGVASAFALVLPCKKFEGMTIGIEEDAIASTIIPLTYCVRRAMVVYQYRDGNSRDVDDISSDQASFCPSIEDGGRYAVFGHAEGYPPRRS